MLTTNHNKCIFTYEHGYNKNLKMGLLKVGGIIMKKFDFAAIVSALVLNGCSSNNVRRAGV